MNLENELEQMEFEFVKPIDKEYYKEMSVGMVCGAVGLVMSIGLGAFGLPYLAYKLTQYLTK